jgi:hypothetical protein
MATEPSLTVTMTIEGLEGHFTISTREGSVLTKDQVEALLDYLEESGCMVESVKENDTF